MKQWYQDRMYARVIRMDGRVDRVQLDCMEDCGTLIASFPEQADWTDIRTVEFAPEMGQNKAGQDGYYIIPHGEGSVGDTILCRFREREDTEMVLDRFAMPIWSCIQSRGSFVAIVSSMTYEYRLAVGVKDGVYSCYACFDLNGHMPYEPITIEFRLLDEKADYNEAARAYREWRERRGCAAMTFAPRSVRRRATRRRASMCASVRGGSPSRLRCASRRPKPSRKCMWRLRLTTYPSFWTSFKRMASTRRKSVWSAGTRAGMTAAGPSPSLSRSASAERRRSNG